MGKELEVKVLNIDKEEIEDKLKKLGAELIKREYQVNTIFDTDERKIKQQQNGYLRIRESRDLINEEKRYIFTLKKNISKNSLRENIEIETEVQDNKALESILSHLDVKVIHRGTKERTSYKYENIIFEIDTWDKDTYPNPYLEIEVEKEEELNKAIDLLDLNREDVTSKSIDDLRKEVNLKEL